MENRRVENYILRLALFFSLVLVSFGLNAQQGGGLSGLEKSMKRQGMVDVSAMDTTLIVNLRYATVNNFTKKILYDSLAIPYLHPVAAKKLVEAHRILKAIDPDYRFLVFDGARPLRVQRKMYEVVQNTPYAAYVANPARTGLHNYGMAVDLTICTSGGKELDMGTEFDFFGAAAGINKEEELIERGVLTRQQVDNRKLLRRVMTQAGFLTIRGEWWHFNAVSLTTAKNNYKVID